MTDHDVDRFLAKVAIQPNGCWYWTGSLFNGGYGRFSLHGKSRPAHVVIWEHIYGPKPARTVLDHFKCDTAWCVQPDHVRPASQRENLLRGDTEASRKLVATHCESGHEFTDENTYVTKEGWRACKECRRKWWREFAKKKRDLKKMSKHLTEQERTT